MPSILIVDDDPGAVRVLARVLADLAELYVATTGEQAIEVARQCRPDLILLDVSMPDVNGFDVCTRLKGDDELADVPVIFVTAMQSPDFEVSSFDHGAADFIAKPVSPPLVRARVKTQLRIKQLTDELRRSATRDPLTGLANRRRFDDLLPRALHAAQRRGEPLALGIVDIDHFKRYNDHYGHPAGDRCLRAVANALSGACHRGDDLVARLGGEEFAILWPQTGLDAAMRMAQRVLEAVAELALPHQGVDSQAFVSVSIGVAPLRQPPQPGGARLDPPSLGELARRLIDEADRALYLAKQSGRGRACAAPADDGSPARVVEPGRRPPP